MPLQHTVHTYIVYIHHAWLYVVYLCALFRGSEDCVEEQSQPKVEPELKPMAAESSVGGANKTGGKKKRKKKQDMDW